MKTDLSTELFLRTYNLRVPLYAIFELTYKCNLLCKHCYIPAKLRRVQELDVERLKQAIFEISQLGGLYIVFTGGEPLLRKEIFSLIEFAKKLNFAVILFSNGSLITQDVAKRLAGVNLDMVEISIYGSEKLHNEFVSSEVFRNVISAIGYLKKYGIKVKLKTILTKLNINEFQYLKSLSKRFGVELKIDYVLTFRNDGDESPLKFQLDNETLYELVIDSVKENTNSKFKNLNPVLCSAGFNIVGVTPEGTVYPCIQFPYKLGDLKKESFIEIWQKKIFETKVKDKRKYKCFSCDLLNFCNRCPGLCYIESGTLYGCSSIMRNMAKVYQKVFNL